MDGFSFGSVKEIVLSIPRPIDPVKKKSGYLQDFFDKENNILYNYYVLFCVKIAE